MEWALHYPALLDPRIGTLAADLPAPGRSRLLKSLEHYHQGDDSSAHEALEGSALTMSSLLVYRAALALALVTCESSHDKFGEELSGSAAGLVGAPRDIQEALPLFVPLLLLRPYGQRDCLSPPGGTRTGYWASG